MRVALLTMVEPVLGSNIAASQASPLRARLRLGGVTLARHQLGTMLAMGCDRIVCMAHALDQDMLELQQVAEHAGARFQVVSGPRGLLGLVSATDDVIALADGLNAAPGIVLELIEAGPAILVQPIEQGLEAGFERIDINHAAAGAWRIPGQLVERLADLPPDCDTFSALQRIALQAGVGQRMLPATASSGGGWGLVRSEPEALTLEADWIRMHVAVEATGNPSLWLAQALVRQFGAALLHAGDGARMAVLAGLACLLLSSVAAWFGAITGGLVLVACAWVLFLMGALLGRIMRATLRLPPPRMPRALIYGALVDGMLILLATTGLHPPTGADGGSDLFAPVMLVGLFRLVGAGGTARWNAWLQDRGVLALLLMLAATLGQGLLAVKLLAVLVLAAGLVVALRRHLARL